MPFHVAHTSLHDRDLVKGRSSRSPFRDRSGGSSALGPGWEAVVSVLLATEKVVQVRRLYRSDLRDHHQFFIVAFQ